MASLGVKMNTIPWLLGQVGQKIRGAFQPVATLADLNSLDLDEIVAGYMDWRQGDPEPGPNRGRAYWHGWMNRARDHGDSPDTPEAAQLAHEVVASHSRDHQRHPAPVGTRKGGG